MLLGVEQGSWDAIERRMTWPRYRAICRARQPPIRKRGDFADLLHFLGADPAMGRGAVLK